MYCLAVVRAQQACVGAAHVHVCWGLSLPAAEKAGLEGDGHAGKWFLPGAQPALHRHEDVPGP